MNLTRHSLSYPRARLTLALVTLAIVLLGCTVAAEPINFGKDQCSFCQMTIVDQQHASQAVTKKGKQFKYDSIECLVNEIVKNNSEANLAIISVSDYGQSKMTPAASATYLISEKIKSPMGANLSGFGSAERAKAAHNENGGELYTWETLKKRFAQPAP